MRNKIAALNAQIARNNAAIGPLRRMPDTQQQIESLEHRNEGLEDKKEIEDELDRFNKGNEGKKISMARRNIGNEIQRLQREAVDNHAAAAAALAAASQLIDIDNAASEALLE